jgi:hypothetical protein
LRPFRRRQVYDRQSAVERVSQCIRVLGLAHHQEAEGRGAGKHLENIKTSTQGKKNRNIMISNLNDSFQISYLSLSFLAEIAIPLNLILSFNPK